jgi:transcriptional regulator with XRE-family HTH domain
MTNEPTDTASQIGPRLRHIRKQRRVTLEVLARETGLTKGYLSKIETSKKVPPIGTLSRISQAINCDISYFFEEPAANAEKPERVSVVRSNERQQVVRGGSSFGYDYESLPHALRHKAMESFVFTFPADISGDTHFEHDGEELIFVLNGVVEFEVAGVAHRLETGDSIYFDSSLPHRGRSVDRKAQALVVIYGPPG